MEMKSKTIEQLGDVYFESDLAFVLAQVDQDIDTEGGVTTYLYLRAKARSALNAVSAGTQSLFAGASALISDGGGPAKSAIWEGQLSDDGLNDDGVAGDGLFSKVLQLAEGTARKPSNPSFLA